MKESIRDRLPVLDLVSFPVMVEGFYDVTPDKQPIVGPVEGHEGLWIAAGLNGRGLMMAPAIRSTRRGGDRNRLTAGTAARAQP